MEGHPIFLTWTIKNFDMCPQPPGQAIESPCFSIDADRTTKFNLLLYPRGSERETKGEIYVSLFLKRHSDGGKEEIKVDASVSLKDASDNSRKQLEMSSILMKNESLGRHDFIERKCLLGAQRLSFFTENELTVLCVIQCGEYFKDTIYKLKYEWPYEDIASNFGELLESGNHSDITIRIEKEEFRAHRVILETRSPTLMKKLVKLENSNTFSLPFIEAPVFRSILKCIYTGQLCGSDEMIGNAFKALNAPDPDLPYLRLELFPSPSNISYNTEIDVLNMNFHWWLPNLECNTEASYYLVPKEDPEWSWMKITIIKTKNSTGFGNVIKFKRMNESDLIIFMQCTVPDKERKVCLKEHLFENEYEWTTPLELVRPCVHFRIRISGYNPNTLKSGYHTKENSTQLNPYFENAIYFQRHLYNIYSRKKNADVALHVGTQKLPAHKAILSCRSEVFSKMFEHDTKESQTGIVTIDDVDESTMASLLMYRYCGCIDTPQCVSSAMKLCSAADKYQVLLLKKTCCQYLKDKITTENIGELLLLAAAHQDEGLKQSCYSFITSHSDEILKNRQCLDALKSRMDFYPDILDVLLQRISNS